MATLLATTINGALTVGNTTSSDIYMVDTDEGTRRIHCNSNRIGFLNQSSGWGSYCDDTGNWYSDYGIYAPIFYDSDNTGYYLNPASTSNLNGLTVGGSSVVTNNGGTWGISITGNAGSATTAQRLDGTANGATLYTNNASYGSWRVGGSRNGWYGIEFENQANLMMNTDTTGFHNNSYGWQWRWTQGTIYVNRSTYGGGTQYTVLDSGNYSSWAIARGGDTVDGVIYYRTNLGAYLGSLSNARLQAFNDNNQSAFMSFHRSGQYAVNLGLDQDNVMRIGGWSASANRWQLDMSGNMTVAGDVTAYSDARLKENIVTVDNALDKVLNLRGVYYNRTDSDDKRRKLGVIAQEILEVIPEVVSEDNTGTYNVSYGNIVGVLIEAIKEQQKQIDELKAKLDGTPQ